MGRGRPDVVEVGNPILTVDTFQTAHPDLNWPRLAGDEQVRLNGSLPGGDPLAFALPGLVPVAYHAWFNGRQVAARLGL